MGLIGFGKISQRVVQLLQPWGTKVLRYSRRGNALDLPSHARSCGLDRLMADSDIVCVLTDAQEHTLPMIGAQQLASMKTSALFINLARGALVDETAVAEVLASRGIAGAALDVFTEEPLPNDSPLRQRRTSS